LGLIQREVEKAGIPTVGISIVRTISENVRPPRTLFLPWPFGHPLGEPFNISQQRTVLMDALSGLGSIKVPGTIIDLPYPWKSKKYAESNGNHLVQLLDKHQKHSK
jgi:hypothetical protein